MAEIEKESATFCKANGCPLPVDKVTHWHEPEKRGDRRVPRWGVCRFHAIAGGSDWVTVTRMIKENIKVIRLLFLIEALDPVVKPITGEQVQAWTARVERHIRASVLPGQVETSFDPAAHLKGIHDRLTGRTSNI